MSKKGRRAHAAAGTAQQQPPARSPLRPWPWLSIAALAVAAHATSLGGAWLWLDHAHLEEGLALAGPQGWLALFTQGFAETGFYRPLMAVSLSFDAWLGGAPWLFHAVNLAWHAAAAVSTAVAAQSIGLSRRGALLAGALFAVHPIASLVAGAIAFRSESMLAVALLVLVAAHLRQRPIVAAVALLLGGLTKETALVVGPMLIAALELLTPNDRRVRIRMLGAEALALGAVGGLRLSFAPTWRASFPELTTGEAIGTRLASVARSFVRLVLPVRETVCDAFPVTPLASLEALLGAAVLAGLLWLAWKRRRPAALLLVALLPSLQLLPVMRWWSPHYLYVPLAFAAILVAEALSKSSDRRVTVAAYVGGAILTVGSLHAGLAFRSDESLWTREVLAEPGCREGQFYLAEIARRERRWDDAADRYERAIAEMPRVIAFVDRLAAMQNLGTVRLEQRRFDDAAAVFRAALEQAEGQRRRELTHNLAAAVLQAGDAAEAARLLEGEVSRPDAMPASIVVRAHALRRLGRDQEALELLRRVERDR